jgi:predicted nucleic acid-binding protein
MSYLVDTSVWSLALRRDALDSTPEVDELKRALEAGDEIFVTGLVLQELLQGFNKPKAYDQIVEYFALLPFIVPDREDYIQAANLRNQCRRKGIQVGTIDALLAQLCIDREIEILTTDKDFSRITKAAPLKVWS